MRKVVCNSCSFAVTEADKSWDVLITTGKCPNCNVYIQPPLPISAKPTLHDAEIDKELISTKNSNSTLDFVIQMPFWSILVFTLKWACASVPAIIVVALAFDIVNR